MTPDIADRNVERLLETAYRPEPIDPAFVAEIEEKLLAAAKGRVQQLPVLPGSNPRYRVVRRRLGWALSAVAAAALVGLVLYARERFNTPAGQRFVPNPDVEITGKQARWLGEVSTGLTARPKPEAFPPKPLATGERLTTGPAERRRVTLLDGSILFLNQNTTVRQSANRELELSAGEVYVEVAPRPAEVKTPFTINAPGRQVAALGTRFAVQAEPNGTGVVVTQGRVQVTGLKDVVRAGQQLLPGSTEVIPAPRVSHLLEWTRDLMATAESPLVPASKHCGGALIALDPFGQEVNLALRNFHIDVHIEDGFARTTIDQTYFNNTHGRLEGTFYFPLPPDAVLSRLAMYVEDGNQCKLNEGGMAEREHARNVFETIMYERRDPALLEWVDGSTFKMRVFPLEGRKEKRILLSYTQRLSSLYGLTPYRFPGGHNMELVRDWSFAARIKNGANLQITSDSHPKMRIVPKSGDMVLSLAEKFIKPDRDVVLFVHDGEQSAREKDLARFAGFTHEGHRYLMLRYRPTLIAQPTRQRRDWIVLFESSANRDPLLARTQVEVVRHLLANAEHDDTIQVLTAGTRVQPLTSGPIPLTQANLAEIIRHLEGTHLIGALDLEKSLLAAGGLARDLQNPHLLHVGALVPALGERRDDLLVKMVPENVRYLGIGIGKRWNRAFAKLAAERTGGFFTQINPDEPLPWRAFELLSTLNTPRLMQVRVVDAAEKAAFLSESLSLAQGEELCAVTRVDAKTGKLPEKVIVSGTVDGQPFVREVSVVDIAEEAGYLPRHWAKLEIDRLLAENAEANKKQIIALSMASYVMSPYTSLLVLETEADYQRFNVDRGRKDHWALYATPDRIPIVYEPDPRHVHVPLPAGDPAKKRKPEEVLNTILLKVPPQFLRNPNQEHYHHPRAMTGLDFSRFNFIQDIQANDFDEVLDRVWDTKEGSLIFGNGVSRAGQMNLFGDEIGKTLFLNKAQIHYSITGGIIGGKQAGRGTSGFGGGGGGGLGGSFGWFTQPMGMPGPGAGPMSNTPLPLGASIDSRLMRSGSLTAENLGFQFIPRFANPLMDGAEQRGASEPALARLRLTEDFGLERFRGLTRLRDDGGFRMQNEAIRELREGLFSRFDRQEMSEEFMGEDRMELERWSLFERPSRTKDKTSRLDSALKGLSDRISRGWNQRNVLYQRPTFTGDQRIFGDLTLYAPGLHTTGPDVLTVLEAEATPNKDSQPGTIHPEARKLIDRARTAAWQAVEFPGGRLIFNGAGQYRREQAPIMGPKETVICDGENLLHLYPEIGLAARRTVSRYHRAELSGLLPWLVLPAEDLARGTDVKMVNERTVAIEPRLAPAKDATAKPLPIYHLHLVFSPEGRLAERQWIEMPAHKILYRETYDVHGTVKLIDAVANKELAEEKWKVQAAQAPDLKPNLYDLVVLSLPHRTYEKLWERLIPGHDFANIDEDVAISLIIHHCLVQQPWEGLRVFAERFLCKGDNRLGFYVLLTGGGMSYNLQQDFAWSHARIRFNPEAEHPHSPLAKYLTHHLRTVNQGQQPPLGKLDGEGSSFLNQLAEFRDQWELWNSGRANGGPTEDRQKHREQGLKYLTDCKAPLFAWALLEVMQRHSSGEAEFHKSLAQNTKQVGTSLGLGYSARYEHARNLLRAGQHPQAAAEFRQMYLEVREAGLVPPIDSDFQQALQQTGNESFAGLLRETSAEFLKKKRPGASLLLAYQCWQLGQQPLAEEILGDVLGTATDKNRQAILAGTIDFLMHAHQFARADALMQQLLEDKEVAESPVPWRLAALIAQRRGMLARSVACLERALDLEYKVLPELINLQTVRADYGNLLGHYQQLAAAMAALETEPPQGLLAKVVRAADRWRSLDADDTQACQAAAGILQVLGARELAWDYLTSPIGQKPNEAAPWLNLAQSLRQEANFELADRAFVNAFQAEPTNAQVLWDRAQTLQQNGRHAQARDLYRQIAQGNWQPRFQSLKQQAQWFLTNR